MTRTRAIVGAVLALGLLAQSLATEAQPSSKMWRLGLVSVAYMKIEDVFFQQLKDLGYAEGHNLIVDRRYSEGRAERFPEFATALVKLNPDMIIVTTTPAALAVKNVTRTIPVVFPNAIDPVGPGVVASLARPGGNITGATTLAPEIFAKRMQLLQQALPHVSTVAVVWNAANPGNVSSLKQVQEAARVLHINVQSREVRAPEDFDRIFADMTRERPDAILLVGDRLTLQHGEQIVDFANQKKIPSILDRAYPETTACLMSYGADEEELWRRAAVLADKILKGTKPADLPFEQPTKFKFVINLKTAKALGLTIPKSVLLRADEVIQ